MALPISMFTKGVLITTPPLIYIFVGDIPVNSLVGGVNSASQESDMRSDDPNALPLEDSSVLPPNPVNPQENSDLPPSDQVVDNGNAKESDQRDQAGDPVVDNVAKEKKPGVSTIDPEVDGGDVKDTNPGVSEGVSQESPGVSNGPSEDGHSSVDEKKDTDNDESKGDSDPSTDDLATGEEDNDDEEEESQTDPNKNKELNEKLKAARIDEKCFLPDLKTVGKCELDKDQMERINFPQRDNSEYEDDDSEFEITGLADGEKITLTIESGYDEDDFPKGGLRLTFHNPNSSEVKITGDGNSDASLLPNIDHDYKFSTAIDKWIDKAWSSLQKLGAKVGLNINDSLEEDECVAGQEINKKINVWKNKREYVIGAESTSESHCLMKATDNNKNLLEGFKLTVRDGKDITLTGGEGPSGGTTIDTLKKDAFYSFAPKRVGDKKVWFLIEKSQ